VIVLTAANAANPQDEGIIRKALQLAAILGISALSWRFVEEPIRHGAIGRFFARRRAVGWGWYTVVPGMRGSSISARRPVGGCSWWLASPAWPGSTRPGPKVNRPGSSRPAPPAPRGRCR